MPTLECPTCRAQVVYEDRNEVPFRPFCSKRCQLIDLGRWLNEEYHVSEEVSPEDAAGEGGPRQNPPSPED